MKLRMKNNRLVDADGREWGKVLEMVIELDPKLEDELGGERQLRIESANVVQSIWEHYCTVMKPRNAGLSEESAALIRKALKVATAEECRTAITGCHASDYHMKRGEYAGRAGPRYCQLSQILKGKQGRRTTREQIDFFIDIAQKRGVGARVASDDPVRIRDAKNDVLAAHEFPDDEHARQRGSEARQWLVEHGWVISATEDGWPTFAPPT